MIGTLSELQKEKNIRQVMPIRTMPVRNSGRRWDSF